MRSSVFLNGAVASCSKVMITNGSESQLSLQASILVLAALQNERSNQLLKVLLCLMQLGKAE